MWFFFPPSIQSLAAKFPILENSEFSEEEEGIAVAKQGNFPCYGVLRSALGVAVDWQRDSIAPAGTSDADEMDPRPIVNIV